MNPGAQIDVIANARVAGAGRELLPLATVDPAAPYDVFLRDGRILDIAPAGNAKRIGAVLDADGAWVIPGLWDHHVHTVPWALEGQRVSLGQARSAAEAARLMSDAPTLVDGRRVGTGYRDAFWADAPSLEVLDAATGDVPTYLINADNHSGWLNSAALRREGFLSPDGVIREELLFETARRLSDLDDEVVDAAIDDMARRAAAMGVVGLVDLHMAYSESDWRRRVERGFDLLRVDFAVYTHELDRPIAAGLRTGDRLPGVDTDLVRMGPYKVITDGSLGTRTAACTHPYPVELPGADPQRGVLNVSPDDLVAHMTRATAAGLACAVHAIGDVANSIALDAFAATGAVGTIEHAQLVRHADIARFARLGVGASVQPMHAVEDRDLVETIWAAQTAASYPLRALHDAGANLLFGSDAPVSRLDPWAAMAAAVFRRDDERDPWRPQDTLDAATALAASTRGGSEDGARILPGESADLALVAHDPLAADEAQLRGMPVLATMIAGRLTHLA